MVSCPDSTPPAPKLAADKFNFVEVLENAETRTTQIEPKNEYEQKSDLDARRKAKVTWDDLVERFGRYVRNHILDQDQSTCILICNILRLHLQKGRAVDGAVVDMTELDEDQCNKYVEMQNNLDEKGISELVCSCLSVHHPGSEGDLADTTVELLTEMLNGGNSAVQSSVCQYINQRDGKGRLIGHLNKRLKKAERDLLERKEETKIHYVKVSEDMAIKLEDMSETFRSVRIARKTRLGHLPVFTHKPFTQAHAAFV